MSTALSGVLLSILLVFIIALHEERFSYANESSLVAVGNGTTITTTTTTTTTVVVPEMVPYIDEGKGERIMMMLNESRRKLGSFQICALCTCCGGANHYCLPTPCCYAINCNIPNRPFGFCSFTPKTCNCLGCHL